MPIAIATIAPMLGAPSNGHTGSGEHDGPTKAKNSRNACRDRRLWN